MHKLLGVRRQSRDAAGTEGQVSDAHASLSGTDRIAAPSPDRRAATSGTIATPTPLSTIRHTASNPLRRTRSLSA